MSSNSPLEPITRCISCRSQLLRTLNAEVDFASPETPETPVLVYGHAQVCTECGLVQFFLRDCGRRRLLEVQAGEAAFGSGMARDRDPESRS